MSQEEDLPELIGQELVRSIRFICCIMHIQIWFLKWALKQDSSDLDFRLRRRNDVYWGNELFF